MAKAVLGVMAICQKCGEENPADARVCTQCGNRFPAPASAMSKTMVGMTAPVGLTGTRPTQPEPEVPAKPNLAGTMIGMPSPFAPGGSPSSAAQSKPSGNAASLGQTMIGVGNPVRSGGEASRSANQEKKSTAETAQPQKKFGQTMLGVAQPGIAPAHSEPAQGSSAQRPSAKNEATGQGTAGNAATSAPRKFQGTLLGIAQPGIAPSPEAVAPPSARTPEPGVRSTPPRETHDRTPAAATSPPRPMWQNAVFVGLGIAAAAGIGGLAAAMGSRPVEVLVTQFSFDDKGRDQLKLSCKKCPNGANLELGDASTTFDNFEATLHPKAALNLGRNELKFKLTGPDGDEIKVRPVILPIAYRYLVNWEGRHDSAPHAKVVVHAPEGSSVEVADKKLDLVDGEATYKLELGERAEGETSATVKIEESVQVKVLTEGTERTATATLRGAVAPLQITTIGRSHQLGGREITVQGRSAPGATITGFGEQAVANKDGKFTLAAGKPQPGTYSITARTKRFVARRVQVDLKKKVPSPEAPVTSFSELRDGVEALLTANVLESRISQGVTRTLLEVPRGCKKSPCLLRGVFAEPKALRPNRTIRIQGDVKASDPFTVRISRFR